ncbi:MAG TPA: hypothetical protein VMV94_16310 [Phycisphaerae bacterium]|nr:hypothetical protein [Phycisphaerae bacterium]
MSWFVPSVYSPIARCGFSRNRSVRRLFRLLFTGLYRKRLWNPLVNSWMENRGFDQRKHIKTVNFHAIGSASCLLAIAAFLWAAQSTAATARSLSPGTDFVRDSANTVRWCYRAAACMGIFDLVFNMPGIVLARYLYLLTLRRPAIQRARSGP